MRHDGAQKETVVEEQAAFVAIHIHRGRKAGDIRFYSKVIDICNSI